MKITRLIITCSLLFLLIFGVAIQKSYSQLEDAIEQLTGETTKGYLQPFVNSFANNLNSGLYRTAHVSSVGLHFYIGLSGMVTMIPDEDKTFMATPPSPFPAQQVETATVFGESGAVVNGPGGLKYAFQNGLLQGEAVPFVVPHIEVGSILGTNVKFRYFSGEIPGDDETLGKIELLGYGLQHSISQYFFILPVDISAGFFYQKFDVGDFLSTKSTSFGLQVSKSIPLFTIYGAAAMESTTMDVNYTFEGGDISEEISLSLDSKSKLRISVGARLKLGVIILNGDYSIGNQTTATVGLGLGI